MACHLPVDVPLNMFPILCKMEGGGGVGGSVEEKKKILKCSSAPQILTELTKLISFKPLC